MDTLSPELEQKVTELVRQAGAQLMHFWPGAFRSRGREGLQVKTKPDGSFVTEADLVSNDLLVAGLRSLFPSDGILSEELPIDPTLASHEYIWIIDPLDGTQTFIDGNDDFAVLLARSRRGILNFGIMFLPAREQLAVAATGRGAKLNGQGLHVSQHQTVQPQRLYLRHIKGMDHSPLIFPHWVDSNMAFLRVCRGEFDGIILRIKSHQEWDLAAAALLLLESGGTVTDEKGKPLSFGKGEIGFRYLVGSNGLVHDELLSLLSTKD